MRLRPPFCFSGVGTGPELVTGTRVELPVLRCVGATPTAVHIWKSPPAHPYPSWRMEKGWASSWLIGNDSASKQVGGRKGKASKGRSLSDLPLYTSEKNQVSHGGGKVQGKYLRVSWGGRWGSVLFPSHALPRAAHQEKSLVMAEVTPAVRSPCRNVPPGRGGADTWLQVLCEHRRDLHKALSCCHHPARGHEEASTEMVVLPLQVGQVRRGVCPGGWLGFSSSLSPLPGIICNGWG